MCVPQYKNLEFIIKIYQFWCWARTKSAALYRCVCLSNGRNGFELSVLCVWFFSSLILVCGSWCRSIPTQAAGCVARLACATTLYCWLAGSPKVFWIWAFRARFKWCRTSGCSETPRRTICRFKKANIYQLWHHLHYFVLNICFYMLNEIKKTKRPTL